VRLRARLAVVLAASASIASAGGPVSVSPSLVEVSAERPWADVLLANEGAEILDVRADTFSWQQDEEGRVALAPARDVTVFPPAARLEPHDVRKFRISLVRPAGERERAYRLALDVREAAGAEDAVVTRALVPVFVEPARRAPAARIEIAPGPGSRCRVVLTNVGTVRIRPPRVSVAVNGRDGTVVERAFEPWWVLAGGARVFDVELPIAAEEVRDVEARAAIAEGVAEARASGCGRPVAAREGWE
jgi:P pilus assembly chaperone PapD